MGLLLTILARLLSIVLIPVGILYSLIRDDFNRYWWAMAVSLDQLGNVALAMLLNDLMINSAEHPFGNVDETISSVLGKNQKAGTLKPLGKLLVFLLDKIEKDHSLKSIEQDEN